jgi:Na+-transporting NADH:ubiquinone oxidoreductase subunit NqrB
MKSLFFSSERERSGTIDGLNLFFGALLGANLGTLDGLSLGDYSRLVVLLAGTVVTLRMVSTSERRRTMFALLGLYLLILAAMTFLPRMQPKGLALDDFHRLTATLAIWILFVATTELSPLRSAGPAAAPPDDGIAEPPAQA